MAAAAVVLAGIGGVVIIIAAVMSEGDGGGPARPAPNTPTAVPSPTAAASPTAATTAPPAPAAALAEIESLARRSIEALPAGEWPSLYDSFTSDFRGRCPRAEFEQAGVQAAADLGDNLTSLRFKRLEEPAIESDSATAVIVGELAGQGEYRTQAAFRREDGRWKIDPAPGTQGCQAFNRLSG